MYHRSLVYAEIIERQSLKNHIFLRNGRSRRYLMKGAEKSTDKKWEYKPTLV